MAVVLGATVIEKHFKLDNYNCTDEVVSLSPSDFKIKADTPPPVINTLLFFRSKYLAVILYNLSFVFLSNNDI